MKKVTNNSLLKVDGLVKHFPITRGIFRKQVGTVKAVDGISFEIKERETLGLVGESGCGKSTTGRVILQLLQATSGKVFFKEHELTAISNRELRKQRPQMQMIFQDPQDSLNPRMTVGSIISEPLLEHQSLHAKQRQERVEYLLKSVGLDPNVTNRYPHEFSGGQRQRIGIARALATNPKLIVADEAVSALDVSIQAQILNLLQDLQNEFSLTYLFIAHDLGVVEHIADRVCVMYVGKVVEMATTEELYANPQHPYTEALLSSVPKSEPDEVRERIVLQGEIANPANPPSGCYFHPRCNYAQDRCREETPAWREVTPGHYTACHFSEELSLRGVVQSS